LSIDFRMPALGADMTEGTLVEWRVQPGAAVRHGDIIALVETAKGIIDVEAFHDGTVERLLVEPGTLVPVGTVLAQFSGNATPPSGAQAHTSGPVAAPARVRISPAARQRALAAGLSIDALTGTGPDGAISLDDIEQAIASAGPAAPPRKAAAAQSAMRSAIGAAMARSKREIPHYYLTQTINFSPALDWLDRFNRDRPVEERLIPAALLVRALARTASEVPGFAGHYSNGNFEPATAIHVGFAIAQRGGGLVVPALLDAATKSLPVIMRELSDLVGRARGGHLRSSELELPVITLTSLGDDGVDAVFPVIFPDQVAIVGAGRIAERPWIEAGQVVPRRLLTLALAADHRVTDGRAGARFLARLATLLESPGEP
jgi:pyruvate dehydrogenase E2 component (dihydrolipoamide acetyltransferase)